MIIPQDWLDEERVILSRIRRESGLIILRRFGNASMKACQYFVDRFSVKMLREELLEHQGYERYYGAEARVENSRTGRSRQISFLAAAAMIATAIADPETPAAAPTTSSER
jgi:hypothetical protein